MNAQVNIEASAKTVAVGCKLPNGLRLDMRGSDGPVQVTLKGSNAARIIGGYGITENVSAEFMTGWLKKNAKHPAVINGSVFIHSNSESAESIARERSSVASGLDPIDPIKNGMLRDDKGNLDGKAVADYNRQRSENPVRNRQIQE